MKSARLTAYQVLWRCYNGSSWADAALKQELSRVHLDERDAALCTHITYGVLQHRYYLQYQLQPCLNKPWKEHDKEVQLLLEIGAYQMLFLSKVPDHAIVNEMVEVSREVGRGYCSSLINAVLRKLSTRKNNLKPVPEEPFVDSLSIQYSFPKSLLVSFLRHYSPSEVKAYLKECNQIVPTTIQWNPLRATKEEFLQKAKETGLSLEEHPWLDGCFYLQHSGALEHNSMFLDGYFQVQDPAAKAAALIAAPNPGHQVLDVCAAPGGKSFAMAMAMNNNGHIISTDVHQGKLDQVIIDAKRLHISCLETKLQDGRVFMENWKESFDVVFCDVPCSGLGIIRKKPDIRYRDTTAYERLPDIQLGILQNACQYVKPNGTLVYSTCTLRKEENENIVKAFLDSHKDFALVPFSIGPVSCDGLHTFWPQKDNCDGFFVAKMRKQ